MESFLKTNLKWLVLPGLALFIVLIAFIFRPKTHDYHLNASESLRIINSPSILVGIKDIAGKQLIDLRSAELFSSGHCEGAINLPVRQLLDKESLEILDELISGGKEVVLYGSDRLQATAPLFLLQQLGYKGLKQLNGGMSPSNELVETETAMTEQSVLDIPAVRSKPQLAVEPNITSTTKKPETIVPVRKVASAGGGC